MAEFFLPGNPADPRITIAFDLSVACFRSAAALFDPCIEPVQIPFEGTTLPGTSTGEAGPAPARRW